MMAVYLIGIQSNSRYRTFSFLRNVECNSIIVIFNTSLSRRSIHQMIHNRQIKSCQILMNLSPAFWRIRIHSIFPIHGHSVLNIRYGDNCVSIQISDFAASPVFFLDIPV